MTKILMKVQNTRKGVNAVMVNYFAMQVEYGWITLEQVPKKWRAKVKALLELANSTAGADEVAEKIGE